MGLGTIVGVGLFVGLVALLVFAGVDAWLVSLSYQRDMGGYYEYADRASDGPTKSQFFDKWVNSIKTQGLESGPSSVFYQNQPTANLANDWNVTTSLQSRLHDLVGMDHNSMQYQLGLQEVSMTEFCWYPDNVYEQAYLMNHGIWWAAISPANVEDSCTSHN